MKKKQYLCFILWTNVIFVPLSIYADHTHSRYRRRINQHEYENNHIQDVPESSSAGGYGSFIINADDAYTPSPTPKESMTTSYMTFNERQSPSANYVEDSLSSNYKHQTAGNTNLERAFPDTESRYKGEKYTPNEKDYGYILTATGKENIYDEDKGAANAYQPREFQVSYPEKFDPDRTAEQKPTFTTTNKRVGNYEKSHNKHRFAYSNGAEDDHKRTKPEFRPLAQETAGQRGGKDTPKARSYNSEAQNYPQYQQSYKFAEDYGQQKSPTPVAWKQLGPNVEISSSADTPTYVRSPPASGANTKEQQQRARKTYNKKRKNTNTKNTRNAYMGPTHALYVANNLQNIKQFKTIFDHNGVLKQSDKFEVGDAMTNEAEKENNVGKKEHRVRIKQESPKDQQPYNYETPNVQNYQFYNPPVAAAPFYNVPAPFQTNKLAYPGVGLSKGFIRMIDVETNANGDKKTIPALIIPLSQDQLSSPLFNPDAAATAFINTLDLANPKTKPVPFPYELVNAKYLQNDPSIGLPFDNYHQQLHNYYPYQFRNTGQNLDDNYNQLFYSNSHYQSLPHKYPFNLNTPASTAAGVEPKAGPNAAAYPTQAAYYPSEDQRSNLPYSIVIPNKKANVQAQSENARTDFKPSEYYEDPNDDSKYLAPSETNFIPTVVDPNETYNSSKSFDKSDLRS